MFAHLVISTLFFSFVAQGVPEMPDIKAEDSTSPPVYQKKTEQPSLGRDMERFGEEVANRIDKIVKKKGFDLWGDPWTLQGVPIIFPSSSNGFNVGLRLALQNIRREDPHLLEVEGQVLASDKGRYKHFFRIDYPWAFDNTMRVTVRVGYDRDISLPYLGVGNHTKVDQSALDNDTALYQNARRGPSVSLQLQRYIGRHFRVGPIFGLRWTDITAPAGSLLQAERPVGLAGGATHHIGLAITRDTLDFEPYPTRGSINELYFVLYGKATGSDYNFTRTTYTYRRFTQIHRKLVFAHRTVFEVLSGQVPFFELGAVGGSRGTLSIGGDQFLRGYTENRFIDRVRLLSGFELRWDPLYMSIYKQDLTLGFVPFFDIGRVWPDFNAMRLDNWHASAGWGVRLIWNSRFIIRSDFAVTPDGTSFYLNLGSAF